MGFWDLINQTPTQTQSPPELNTPYKVYTLYFSPFSSGGLSYSFSSFRDAVREVRNHGLNITSLQAHAMRLLAKHGDDWFNEDGTLKEGLSRGDAKKALEYKRISSALYDRLKPKAKKKKTTPTDNTAQTQARWAVSNFITNGYDRNAAAKYATITDAKGISSLWNGLQEQDYYNSLTAPQKRAYLALRQLWISNGILKPEAGKSLATLTAVTDNDMRNYIKDSNNILNWHNIYYGDNGYIDEYNSVHPVLDEDTKKLYLLYGITPNAPGTAIWKPSSVVRTSGFTIDSVDPVDPDDPEDPPIDPKNKKYGEHTREEWITNIQKQHPGLKVESAIDENGNLHIKIGDKTFEYDENAKVFVSSKKIGGKIMNYFQKGGKLNSTLGALDSPKELEHNGWDYVPGVASIRSIGRAFQNPTPGNIFWAVADPALDLSTVLTLGAGTTWATAGRTAGKGVIKAATKAAGEALLKEGVEDALIDSTKAAMKFAAKKETKREAKNQFFWGLPGATVRIASIPTGIAYRMGQENPVPVAVSDNTRVEPISPVVPVLPEPARRDTLRWEKQGGNLNIERKQYFKEGGRFIPKALAGHSGLNLPAVLTATVGEAPSATNVTVAPATPPTQTLYQRNATLLGYGKDANGNTVWLLGAGASDAQAYMGSNNHMSRREMRRFNKEQGLGMNKALRRAFRRAYNNDQKAGDDGIMVNYLARLNNTVPGAKPTEPTEPIKPATKEETQALQRNALKAGWQAYNNANAATKGFSESIGDIQDINGLISFMKNAATNTEGNVPEWALSLDLTTGENGLLSPELLAALQSAYLGSLNAGDYNIFADKYNNFLTDAAQKLKLRDVYKTANDWLASDEARDLYQNAVNDEALTDYRAQAAKDALLALMRALGTNFNKKGGTMTNKYQLGGAAPAQLGQDMQTQVTLLVLAAMSGDELATQTINKIMEAAKAGDQQAMQIAQMILTVVKLILGAQALAAKRGAKLNYLHSLVSGCPEDTEAKYFRKGGHICKTCVEKTKKVQEGIELPQEKCGGKAKKKYFVGGSTELPKEKCGGKAKKKCLNGTVIENKCGGKTKKKKCLNGGILTLEALQTAYKSLYA